MNITEVDFVYLVDKLNGQPILDRPILDIASYLGIDCNRITIDRMMLIDCGDPNYEEHEKLLYDVLMALLDLTDLKYEIRYRIWQIFEF